MSYTLLEAGNVEVITDLIVARLRAEEISCSIVRANNDEVYTELRATGDTACGPTYTHYKCRIMH